ncbi:tetratricopeptide repeat protein [Ferrimonas lipolytica]|uniref:Tetratricopeptide repeat protein n=1 Tax=Ferrimonas lipolytica TaxID=2724191 RepID=A0A6H1UG03_9GAMM|nr:tetratricopeptide repeat protein [Ferrimonas lipolytica]QIZ77146.1 tetratricopeptide repeat protein [Ferrimonas lipolytica]
MSDNIFNANAQNIQQLVEASKSRPVVMNFHSAQVPECAEITNALQAQAQIYPTHLVLANVDCDTQMELAQYFRIQGLPTVLVLSNGQPVDGFAGPQPAIAVETMLAKHLPAEWQLKLEQALPLLDAGEFDQAVLLLREALAAEQNGATLLSLAQALLGLKKTEEAETLLALVKLEDQDSRYTGLMSQLSLLKESADTPEIRNLQQQLAAEPDNHSLIVELGKALHQAGRNEEALAQLFDVLRMRLDAADGDMRKTFLDIVNALGSADPVASSYRRKFYGLLY